MERACDDLPSVARAEKGNERECAVLLSTLRLVFQTQPRSAKSAPWRLCGEKTFAAFAPSRANLVGVCPLQGRWRGCGIKKQNAKGKSEQEEDLNTSTDLFNNASLRRPARGSNPS
jgi:hypothetical protein